MVFTSVSLSYPSFASTPNSDLKPRQVQPSESDSTETIEVLQLLETWGNDGSGKYSIEQISLALRQVLNAESRRRLSRYSIIFVVIVITMLLLSFITSLTFVLLMARQKVQDVDMDPARNGDSLGIPQHYEHINLAALHRLPLEAVENIASITMLWRNSDSGEEEKIYSKIESAMRHGEGTTILRLSSNYRLEVNEDNATLYDDLNQKVNEIRFSSAEKEAVQENLMSPTDLEAFKDTRRRLGKRNDIGQAFGRYPITANQGMPESFFDAYCRYGCGSMAVTFPYYYRPFYGYGFPLVGTEAMFPQGYGGYPAAPLFASQASGGAAIVGSSSPSIAGGFNVPMGVGTTTVSGGAAANAVPVSLPNANSGIVPPGVQGRGMPINVASPRVGGIV